jgi:hypothetical protein
MHGTKVFTVCKGSKLPEDSLNRLHQVAASRKGACLSASYLGARAKHAFSCEVGHEWQARACNVLAGRWCRECVFARQRNRPLSITVKEKIGDSLRDADGLQQLQQAASARGGRCLSMSYTGAHAHYNFACRLDHRWSTRGFKVLYGSWCLQCARAARKLTIEDAKEWARSKAGQCLSEKYVGVDDKLQWVCSQEHSWSTSFSNVRAGHWCPACARAARVGGLNAKARSHYEVVKGLNLNFDNP